MPAWFTGGMTVDGGMVVAVGYAMVINLVDDSTLQKILSALAGGTSLTPEKVTTLQDNLNQLIPVFAALLLTFACMWLLKRKVSLSPISIIFVFFALGVLDHVTGII
ncbi:PTS system mannose/fructose/sorbose family transporter subunit IID [uncultured Granulicatella sp.]|uniref:PTS system mannose/fructose/sorbose family transporter subunit IID n=2 Tax=uncultured Granulicatella sp. TaxID=316089 RepID=UPI0028D83DB0|nr:PTS system mannose/fructose/sorbose family transporter subunit IID [uncultured Granulicatella sp.]